MRARAFSFTMSDMKQNSAAGSINILLIPLVVAVLLLIGAVAFGVWAFQGRQDYKYNVDQKINSAVAQAKQQLSIAKDKEFAAKEKLPLRTYSGPAAYGSVTIQYPKTWSAYVSDATNTDPYVDGYFYPNTVPNINDQSVSFALRVQVVQQSYSSVLANFQPYVQQKQVTVTPYKAPRVPNVIGSRLDGQITPTKTGSMIILPLRDKTLKLWTESPLFMGDFNNNILPNFTFSP